MPRTRCSRASSSTLRPRWTRRRRRRRALLDLLADGVGLGLAARLGQGRVEGVDLVLLLLLRLHAGRRGVAGELLPVTGPLEQRDHGLGRLSADRQPVLSALGVDLDHRRVVLGVVLADLLDRPTVTLGARVGDDDAVVRRPDLAQSLETNLDSHVCGYSCLVCLGFCPVSAGETAFRRGSPAADSDGSMSYGVERAPHDTEARPFCQILGEGRNARASLAFQPLALRFPSVDGIRKPTGPERVRFPSVDGIRRPAGPRSGRVSVIRRLPQASRARTRTFPVSRRHPQARRALERPATD